MAKSKKVDFRINYPYPNVMVVERIYEYEDGVDAKRPQAKLPAGTTKGWTAQCAVPDEIEISGGHIWIVREIYTKRAMRYPDKKKKGK